MNLKSSRRIGYRFNSLRLQARRFTLFVKLCEILVLIYGKLDSYAAVPARKLDSVHKLNAVYTLDSVNEKFLSAEKRSGKVINNTRVLMIQAVSLDLDHIALGLCKAVVGGF